MAGEAVARLTSTRYKIQFTPFFVASSSIIYAECLSHDFIQSMPCRYQDPYFIRTIRRACGTGTHWRNRPVFTRTASENQMALLSALFIAVISSSLVSALNWQMQCIDQPDKTLDITIQKINMYYTDIGLQAGVLSGNIDVITNPWPAEAAVDTISAIFTYGGNAYLSIAHSFPTPGVVITPNTTVNTGRMNNFKVESDLTGIMRSGISSIDANNIYIDARTPTTSGTGGFPLQFNGEQYSIPIEFIAE